MRSRYRVPIFVTLALLATAAVIVVALMTQVRNDAPPAASPENPVAVDEAAKVVQEGPADSPVLIEFLDFECEACGAFYPVVEDLRDRYDGQFTYAFRYFPLPSHNNSTNAALAVEAANQQGQLEAMYARMFETQREWGESQDSKAELFRGYAEDLGLDLAKYDDAIEDPATLALIEADFNAGASLGVSSTPTFYLDGELIELQALQDLETALVAAIES